MKKILLSIIFFLSFYAVSNDALSQEIYNSYRTSFCTIDRWMPLAAFFYNSQGLGSMIHHEDRGIIMRNAQKINQSQFTKKESLKTIYKNNLVLMNLCGATLAAGLTIYTASQASQQDTNIKTFGLAALSTNFAISSFIQAYKASQVCR